VNTPTALDTVFGWIIFSPASMTQYDTEAQVSLCITECDTNILLCKFWKDEKIPQKLLKEEGEQCERYFVSIHFRTVEGRYMVRLPFKIGPPIDIGDSLPIATALHAQMESRLQSRPEISKQYYDFLHEYLELGHTESVTENCCYIVQTSLYPVSNCYSKLK